MMNDCLLVLLMTMIWRLKVEDSTCCCQPPSVSPTSNWEAPGPPGPRWPGHWAGTSCHSWSAPRTGAAGPSGTPGTHWFPWPTLLSLHLWHPGHSQDCYLVSSWNIFLPWDTVAGVWQSPCLRSPVGPRSCRCGRRRWYPHQTWSTPPASWSTRGCWSRGRRRKRLVLVS